MYGAARRRKTMDRAFRDAVLMNCVASNRRSTVLHVKKSINRRYHGNSTIQKRVMRFNHQRPTRAANLYVCYRLVSKHIRRIYRSCRHASTNGQVQSAIGHSVTAL